MIRDALATLVLADDLRLEGAFAISRYLDAHETLVRDDSLPMVPLRCLACPSGSLSPWRIPQVLVHLCDYRALDHRLLKLAEH